MSERKWTIYECPNCSEVWMPFGTVGASVCQAGCTADHKPIAIEVIPASTPPGHALANAVASFINTRDLAALEHALVAFHESASTPPGRVLLELTVRQRTALLSAIDFGLHSGFGDSLLAQDAVVARAQLAAALEGNEE